MSDSTARQLRDALRAVLMAHGVLEDAVRPCGTALSMPHAHALLSLSAADGPMSVSSLARTLQIDRTNVSRLCARMQASGEVTRTANPADARSRLIALTDLGNELAGRVDRNSTAHFRRVLEALGPSAPDVVESLQCLVESLVEVNARSNGNAS